LAKSSQSGANYGMKLDLSDAIAKLKALQDEMKKTFGTAGEGGTVTMKLGLDVSGAKQALKDLVAKPLTVKININPGDVKSQIQKAIGSLTVSPMADRTNQLFSDQPKIQRAIQQGSGSSYRPGTSIVPYESFRPYERLIENAFRATVPPSYDAGGNRVYSDAMIEVYKQQSRAMNVVPNSGYTYWESAYRGNISAARNARYTPNWSQDFASTSREIQAASAYAKTHHEAPYQYQQRYTPNWQAANYYNGSGWYDYTSKLFGNMSDQKPFQKWEMTNIPGYAKPWEQQRGSGVNPFGLYMFSSAMSSVANKLDSMFGKVEESYDTSALSFRKTQLVSGMGSDQFESYKNSLLDLAGETMTHVPTLAEMGYSFATRGYMNPETASDVLRPLAISGLITGEDPVTMGKSVMSLMQAWNPDDLTSLEKRAPELVRNYSDMMTYAYANSPLETRWFKDIANYAAPVFAGLGFEPTETMSTFMAMSQMIPTPGIGARSARMAISNLFDVNKLGTVSDKYGIDLQADIQSVREAGGGLAEVFQKLGERINSLPEWEQNSFMRTIGGGVRGGMALQALLPVIGNIQTYKREIEAESEGYTYMKQLEYQTTPYGQLQSAEAEREAILYGTGEKTVGIRTSIMKLENTMLKLVQKLPEPLLAAGYAAGKGFEGVGNVASTFANLAIINALGKQSGMLGNFGPVFNAAAIAVPIASAIAGAISSDFKKGQEQDDEEWSEKHKGSNPLIAAKETIEDIRLVKGFTSKNLIKEVGNTSALPFLAKAVSWVTNAFIAPDVYGDTFSEKAKNLITETPYEEYGELQNKEHIEKRLATAEELFAQAQENTVKLLPISDDKKDNVSEMLSKENEWLQSVNLTDVTSDSLKENLKRMDMYFGDMGGLAENDYIGRQQRSYKNIDDYVDSLGLEGIKKPDVDAFMFSNPIALRNMLLDKQKDASWGDSDFTSLSNKEISKGIAELFGADAFDIYGDKKDDVVQYYTEMIQSLNGINKNFDDVKTIIESINDNTSELNSPMDATYGELFDAWTSGFLGTDTLPGMGDFAPLSLGYDSKDFAGTVIPAFNFAKQGSWANSGSGFLPVIDEDYTPSNKGRNWQGPGAYDIENILGTFNDAAGSLDKASIHINEGGIHTLTC